MHNVSFREENIEVIFRVSEVLRDRALNGDVVADQLVVQ